MKELTTEQMEERIRNVKEQYSKLFANDDDVIVIGAGSFHNEIADRLQLMADKMSTALHIVTTDDIQKLSAGVNQPIDSILDLIELCSRPAPRSIADDIENLAKIAASLNVNSGEDKITYFDKDDRKWYDVAANKGGKKRKQNYNNRQPWSK